MKIKKIAITLIIALFVSTAVVSGQEGNTWKRYTSATGFYNVLLPGEPTLEEQDATSPEGRKFKQYMAKAVVTGQFFMVAYFDVLSGTTYSLEKGRDGLVKAVGGTLLSDELISLGGKPGRRLRVRAKAGKVNATDLVQMYEINGRVYVLQSIFAETVDEAAYVAHANKFFDSFSVKAR